MRRRTAARPAPHLVDHVLKLRLGRVLAERAHDSAKLLRGDGAVTILVEQGECLLELGNLLLCSGMPPLSTAPRCPAPPAVPARPWDLNPALPPSPLLPPGRRPPHRAGPGPRGHARRRMHRALCRPARSPPRPRTPRCPRHTGQLVSHFNALMMVMVPRWIFVFAGHR